jgi:iron complex outermembrane receptor protein
LGYKSTKNDWNTDVSVTTGETHRHFTVSNSHNRSKDSNGDFIYRLATPTFKPGGTSFNHIVGNLDISKVLSDKISIGFGSVRTETFEILPGDDFVHWTWNSFQGNTPNSGKLIPL